MHMSTLFCGKLNDIKQPCLTCYHFFLCLYVLCHGPVLLYVIYAWKLFNIIERHLPDAHCYADDSQLYLSFRPADGLSSQTDAIQAMERCIEGIQHWMVSDGLLLNDEKTEFLLIGTRQQLCKVKPLPLRAGTMDIEAVNCVRNLGAYSQNLKKKKNIYIYIYITFWKRFYHYIGWLTNLSHYIAWCLYPSER